MANGSAEQRGEGTDASLADLADFLSDSPTYRQRARTSFASPPAIGKLLAVWGEVAITRGKVVVVQSTVGDLVYQNDLIETGNKGLIDIVFVDGTTIRLYADAHLVLTEFVCSAEKSSNSALLHIAKGVFGFVAGKMATIGRLVIETPGGQIRTTAPAAAIGSLAFGVLTIGLIHELKAASADIALLDDGTIEYKDYKHGIFEIETKGDNPRVIVVDDPGETIVLRPSGGGFSVERVANSPAQMAQLQSVYQGTLATFSQGQQDPVIQQLQRAYNPDDHAQLQSNPNAQLQSNPNAQLQSNPSSTASAGSSTPPSSLNINSNGNNASSTNQLVQTQNSSSTSITVTANVASGSISNNNNGNNSNNQVATITTPLVAPPPTETSTVQWTAATGNNWDTAVAWSDSLVPTSQQTVEILMPVNVTLSDGATAGGLVIGAGATLDIVTGGSLTVANAVNNAGVIELNDPTLSIDGTVMASGGGVINMLGSTTYNLIIGVPSTGATLVNVNNTITGSGMIGQGDGNLTLVNEAAGIINANVSGEPIIINTGNPVTNAGLIEATNGGTLTIDDSVVNSGTLAANGGILDVVGAVSGSGSATISGVGMLELGGTDAQTVTFNGAGTLKLDGSSDFTGTVAGLAIGDVIDLANTTVTTAIWNGSTLTVNSEPATFTISGLPSGDTFFFASDGGTGTDFTVETAPTIVINAIEGNNIVTKAQQATGFSISGTASDSGVAVAGQTIIVDVVNSSDTVVDSYTGTVQSNGTWSVNVSSTDAQALANGSYTVTANLADVAVNAATEATQTVTVQETAPVITMALIDGTNVINAAEAAAGVTISGTETGANGQTVTVTITNTATDTVVDTLTTTAAAGTWSTTLTSAQAEALANGTYTFSAAVSDSSGNAATPATQTVTAQETAPVITMALIDGTNVINAAEAAAGVTISGTETGANGQTVTVTITNTATDTVVDTLTTTAAAGTWSTTLTSAQAEALANGTYTFSAAVSNSSGNAATPATQTVTAQETAPVITMALIDGTNVINAAEAAAGVTISGTETGANGQTVTVTITNTATDTVVDTLTTTAAAGTWSTTLTSAQAEALANGTYTFSAAVSDSSGNAATPATQTVTAQETAPVITMALIDGTNVINAAEAAAGVTISGTETGANGQTVTVTITNTATDTVVDTLTTTAAAGTWSTTLTSAQAEALANGTYTFSAAVSDSSGNAATPATQTVTAQETAPVITMALIDGTNVINAAEAAAGVTISGTETGANGQTVTVTITNTATDTVVDTLTTTAAAGTWSTTLTSAQAEALANGTYTFSAAVSDSSGNAATPATQTVTAQETAPVITMALIDGTNVINAAEAAAGVTISGTETGANGQTVTVTITNTATDTVVDTLTTTAAAGTWSTTLTSAQAEALANGTYTFSAAVSDSSGNAATPATQTVTAQETAPVITMALIDGTNVINAAEAAAGVTISGTETGANGQTVTVTITNTATDTVVDTLTTTAAAGTWSTTLTSAQAEALANGTYTFSAAVSNSSGNAATPATQTVTAQETAPVITMALIDGTNVINAAEAAAGVTISGTETGANGQTVTVTITNTATDTVVDTLTTTAAAGTWSTTLTSAQAEALANGTYTFSAAVSDSSGNAATPATQTVTAQETAPVITMALIDGTNVINAAEAAAGVTISGTETGANGQTVTVTITNTATDTVVDTLTTTAAAGTWSTTLTSAQAEALANGTYTFSAAVSDSSGNAATPATQTVTAQETAPVITMALIDGTNVINAAEAAAGVTISGTETGANGQTVTVTITNTATDTVVDTLTTTAAAGTWSTTLTSAQAEALANGTYTFSAAVSNSSGNAATPATQTVTAQETAPVITMALIDGTNVINAAEAAAGVTISGTETGANGQTVTVTITNTATDTVVDTLTTTAAAGTWSTTLTSAQAEALANGTYTFSAAVSDSSGNAATPATQTVTAQETAPVITMALIDGTNVINAAEAAAGVTISGTETGANGQTVTVTITNTATDTVVDTLTTTAAAGTWSTTPDQRPGRGAGQRHLHFQRRGQRQQR